MSRCSPVPYFAVVTYWARRTYLPFWRVKGITVIDNLPHRGLAAIVAPFIRTAIADAEPQIIAALGGEEQALLVLLEAQIALAAAKFGG